MTCLILFYFSLDLKADALARTNIKINMEKFLEVSPVMAYLELLYFFPLTLSYARVGHYGEYTMYPLGYATILNHNSILINSVIPLVNLR